jgi:demethylmenaquinone methyltransferase / 2-methoxy-6-polyprenyl-1,4-benzoquinol methylase
VLDLATGTADVAILAAEELRRKGLTPSEEAKGKPPVLGIDPSAGMLALGRDKVAAKGLESVVSLSLGDAQALGEVPSGSVDKIAMSFGIRNVEDRPAALREMARVLRKRPESRVGILEFQLPRSGPLRYIGDFMVRYGAPAIGALLTGLKDEYVHLKRSILEFPSQEGFAQLMREAGLEVVAVKETGFGVVALFLARPSEEAIATAATATASAASGSEAGARAGAGRDQGRAAAGAAAQ